MNGPGVESLDAAALPRPGAPAVLLDAYAAGSCPVKTQHRFDPRTPAAPATTLAPDDPAAVRAETARRHRAVVVESLIQRCAGRVVDLRLLAQDGPTVQVAATRQALLDRADVVVGGVLPADLTGRRAGAPAVLVRGADRAEGGPGYHPVVVKGHKIVEAARPLLDDPRAGDGAEPSAVAAAEPRALAYTTLERPWPTDPEVAPGLSVRLRTRETDFRQLAHYERMLRAAGFAADRAWAGVIGVDELPGVVGPVLAWTDLAQPVLRTSAPERAEGWRRASVLERYDRAFERRLVIAAAAAAGEPALLEPVVVRECATCPWWAVCRSRLSDDDVSLRVDRGALDRREVEALRGLGAGTVTELATRDLDVLLPAYLPLVAHRSAPEARLRTARRRARMLVSGQQFVRETDGPVDVPAAAVEVDFDLESAADGRVYLWGFWVERPARSEPGHYVAFDRFVDLDETAETDLAVAALGWLRELVRTEPSVAVYHYSGFEVTQIQALAARAPHPVLDWAATYAAEHFVDLLEIVKQHWFGVHGLGLKLIAGYAGFAWRDEDPGGLNSQRWFADAVHADDGRARSAARQRVLEYNEDDVRATHALRAWMRRTDVDPARGSGAGDVAGSAA